MPYLVRDPPEVSMPPPRILVADDSALLRSALRGLFRGMGDYEILEAETGTEALAKAVEFKPDLIILDFVMPEMDGLNASRALQRRCPEIPILLYSMHYSEQLLLDAKSAGAKTLISKSETGELVSAVQELLNSRSASAKPESAASVAAAAQPQESPIP